MNPEDNKAQVVTQDALLKSLQDIEKLAKGETIETPAAAPVAEATPEPKPAAEAITDTASEDLKKGLNASPLLKEIVEKIGSHVDGVLGELRKSIDNGAQRDVAILGTFESMQKSMTELAERLVKVEKEPAAPADARPVTATTAEIVPLNKSEAGAQAAAELTPEQQLQKSARVKAMVLGGLEKLVKSATDNKDSESQKRFTSALIKFESTGQISDLDLAEARQAIGSPQTAAA